MNYNEWQLLKRDDKKLLNWTFYNASHRLMKKFNITNGTNKTEVHHLRDTEEQRLYNDTYYEQWGFNEDGTFEYGKYVIFVTREEHSKIHTLSDETRKKISKANKGRKASIITRKKLSEAHKGKTPWNKGIKHTSCNNTINKVRYLSDEHKRKISLSNKGKVLSDEHKRKISLSNKGKIRSLSFKQHLHEINSGPGNPMYGKSPSNKGVPMSDEQKHKISIANSGENNGMYGKHLSDEHRSKISKSLKGRTVSESHRQNVIKSIRSSESVKRSKANMQLCKEHFNIFIKQNNIQITWNQFQKLFTNDYTLLKAIILFILGHVDISKYGL